MVKFPGNLHHLAKIDLVHANDVISEYIASKVVGLYMRAHVVDLGWYYGKQCVACKELVQYRKRMFRSSRKQKLHRHIKVAYCGMGKR